ncbi:MAG: aspartate aminotransferase family protein [Sandaracinaceae bacterium]
MSFGRSLPEIRTRVPGPRSVALVERLARTECPALTMRRARRAEASGASTDPIVYAAALGANVRDVDDNVYVDLCAGFSVAAVGHAHPRVQDALRAQTGTLIHALGDVFPSDTKIALLEALVEWVPFEARVILGLNGADALAAALKTAVLATGRPGVLAFSPGYHGLMYGPLALCGFSDDFRAPFAEQLNPHVRFARYPLVERELDASLAEVDAILDDPRARIGAVVVEPALGRGGLRFAPPGFMAALRARADRAGALLVVDEIFTGFGRTGARWACPDEVVPDLVCAGKALGGGMPISACFGKAEVMAAWGQPDQIPIHTATFAGHPLGCAAALASLQVIEDEGLVARAAEEGAALSASLRHRVGEHPCVRDVRGRGLMIGVELRDGRAALRTVARLLERGYLVLASGPTGAVLQITPPLTIDRALLDAFVDVLPEVLDAEAM